jgi:Protein of unknown function (DUF4236)
MGLYFRKGVGLGPLALNIGKRGVGISTGIRGIRAGVNSHGKFYTSANIPGTGLYYRRYYAHHHGGQTSSFAAGFWMGVILFPLVLVILVGWALR